MTPAEFRTRWNDGLDKLKPFPAAALSGIQLSADCKAFLTEAGLPEDASPFLSFGMSGSGRLESVAEVYGLGPELGRYIMIGSDGSGNPICLDIDSASAVKRLDHEAGFRPVALNHTVAQLTEALLAYRHLVRETIKLNGDDAFLDGNIPQELRVWLESELRRIDLESVNPGSFWADELLTIDANREQWEATSKAGK